jgi:hypothetical protein
MVDPDTFLHPTRPISADLAPLRATTSQVCMTDQPSSPISRTFRDLSDKEIVDSESTWLLAQWGMQHDIIGWDDLLKSPRILIVSEAGVGKTFECHACRDRLWANGEAAFVLELSTLADVSVPDMLDGEELLRLAAWLRAQSETATFFLDSIDELKISQKSFEQALKRLSRTIAGHLGRTRIIITTRPIPIDRQLIEKHLPVSPIAGSAPTAEAFAEIAMDRQRQQKETSAEPKLWRNVALMPLLRDQIVEFAAGQGVTDSDVLLADIERRDALEYALRPQDLIELCSDWKDHQRIRSHREQVETNASTKLKPRADRAEKVSLSVDRAMEGATRLALAAILKRKLTIRYSAESDRIRSSEAALDPSKILTDWSQGERDTLLERALFGFANYGRVRFHHRSVIEFLAARRLDALVVRGVPIKAIKRLLFAETAQGNKVVRPSMRPVAAWLSIQHEGIFAEVKEREPEVLLNHGDPQSLRSSQRNEVLKAYIERYGKGGWRGLRVPAIQVHRFVSTELSQSVKSLWASKIENREVRELIFELIAAGKLTDCADIAHSVAVDAQAIYPERTDALDALIALDDDRLISIAASMVTNAALWPADLARAASLRLFPKHLRVDQLCAILPRIKEVKRAIGDLSWKLPLLIAEKALSPEALEELRVELTTLMTEGAEWRNEAWPHTRTKRPDIVPSLIAACIRQLRAGARAPELFRSSVLALRFFRPETSSESLADELREFLVSASSEQREVAFWADDAFLQSLHPSKGAWDRVFELSQNGGIRLTPEKDYAWVMRRLADTGNSVREREMMIEAATIELVRPGDDLLKVLESLRLCVADSPSLLSIVESRMKPGPNSKELRRFEEENARRKKESEEKRAKDLASWIDFWREIAKNPDAVFDESRADNTAWNLWRAMARSGRESRASGWNRRFIEQHFDRLVADRLRTALLQIWRKDKPTLRSERSADKKNTFLIKWQLGLAAIYAEAEDPLWATKLTEEEARLASRYALIELNSFPAWLDALVAAHPKAVDAVLGEEISLSLRDASHDGDATSSLQNVRHATPRVTILFIPRIKAWLDQIRAERPGNDAATVARLSRAVDVLMQSEEEDLRKAIADIASDELSNGLQSPFAKVWMPVLLQLNPEVAVNVLEAGISGIPPSQDSAAVEWFSALFGNDHRGATVDLRSASFPPRLLLRLVRLAYQHVRPADDAKDEHSDSPDDWDSPGDWDSSDDRDHAERGRNTVLSALLATTGTEGWAAIQEMAQDPLFANFKDRAAAVARERAAEDVDSVPLDDAQFIALDHYGEAAPSTLGGMFTVMRDRLEDLDDLLLEDVSPREAWANITDERVMRREIARELRNSANRVYTVDQEAATADEKETDIRMRATASLQQATIELKIGDKSRTGAGLRATIKDQLLTKYMAAEDCRSGCLMVTLASDKTWTHPETGKQLDFDGLIAMLNEEASRLSDELGGSARLMAKGLDLRPRLKTERAARGRK